jgi:phosphoribosylanthranilate isomerase
MTSLEVKICGITRAEDALTCVRAGANALGLVFYKGSPRYVSVEQACEIASLLAGRICLVGVFVDLLASEVTRIASRVGLHFLQFHGRETPDYCASFPRERIIKAFSPVTSPPPEAWAAYPVRAFLLDSFSHSLPGGTGRTTDWNFARQMARRQDLILAGGLRINNIEAAVKQVRPQAVDVSSGLEARPGIKDPVLIENFMNIIAQRLECHRRGPLLFTSERPIYPRS